ncbi:MAG: adenylate/guanylate cyclase domain-containing protein [Chloroflexi bacterium]|nr:adenylate/guanylate cyclase domain-containing protein [Chloroflexota bacterium]
MSELPTGTVTFLFSDIEGSTRLLQTCGDRWPPLLRRHQELLGSAFREHRGIVVGTEGDSFFVVFSSPADALRAAIDAQRSLADESWPADGRIQVRMGIHTGDGQLSGDTYVGLDVHRAARIMSAGHGGQVLVSATTESLVRGSLPEDATLSDLGVHRLKDLAATEQIFSVRAPGIPDEFPPLRAVDVVPNTLPTPPTSFVGRDDEIREIAALLESHRLVTLTGPGGTGKTRLSLRVASEIADRFPDGTHFVPLDGVHEVELVLPAIGQVLGLADPGREPLERLPEHIGARRCLLVLDNLEQVVDAAPDLAELLRRTTELRLIVTSRSALRIYGEQEFPVPPLPVPETGAAAGSVGSIAESPAVLLFVERARAVRPGFGITEENAAAVAEICRRLEGLPLAIELAAARIRILSPEAMLARISSTLELGAGGARDLPERQQTLRGAIAWSHDLLDERDRAFFSSLAVFVGGADLESIDAVIGTDDALDAIGSLLDKSLLRQGESETDARFRMLETIREYAYERLVERGAADEMRRRHAEHYIDMAERLAAEIMGPRQKELLDRLDRERDNLRAAIASSIDLGETTMALRALAAMWRFWQMRGYLVEGRERARRILALPGTDADPLCLARAQEAAGGIAYWQGDFAAAREHYGVQLEVHRQLSSDVEVANALYNRIMSFVIESQSPGGGPIVAEQAMIDSEEALAIYRRIGDRLGEGRVLWSMMNYEILTRTGDWERIAELGSQSLEIFTAADDRFMLAWTRYMLGIGENLRGRPTEAHAHNVAALELFRETGDLSGYALVLDGLAVTAFRAGDRVRSMRLAGAANAIQTQGGAQLGRLNREWSDFFPEELVKDPELGPAYEEGRRMPLEAAIELGLESYPIPAGEGAGSR